MIWLLPNLAKYNYEWSPIEQHHKIEKKKSLDDPRIIFLVISNIGGYSQGISKISWIYTRKKKIPAFLSKPNK